MTSSLLFLLPGTWTGTSHCSVGAFQNNSVAVETPQPALCEEKRECWHEVQTLVLYDKLSIKTLAEGREYVFGNSGGFQFVTCKVM